MSVKIGFSTNKHNLLSNLIRKVTDSPVSHSFFVTDWNGTEVMIEAHWNGLRVIDFKQWERAHPGQLVSLIEPMADIQKGFDALIPYLGQPYDVGGLFGMLFVYVGRWLKRKVTNPFDSHSALFCSEAVAQVLSWVSYPGWKLPVDGVSPADLFDFFKAENVSPPKP